MSRRCTGGVLSATVVIWICVVTSYSLLAPIAYGNDAIDRGKAIYQRCVACHSLERNRTGPKHCGLFGRRAGSVPDFKYSLALTESGIIWNGDALDRFLRNPLEVVPGTRMGYAGVKDSLERAQLIAYLKWASVAAPECIQ